MIRAAVLEASSDHNMKGILTEMPLEAMGSSEKLLQSTEKQ